MFACAHPAIDVGIRAPMILQVVLGLDAKTIASAFLMSPAAMGKRLVRAKDKLRQSGIPFGIPGREELPGRLDAVLSAIYAAFAEGWTDPAGTDAARRDLTEEAMFLARLVTGFCRTSRRLSACSHSCFTRKPAAEPAQRTREYVPLAEQDPTSWDSTMIGEAEALLRHASSLGVIGRYQLEGALQSAHVHRCARVSPNWGRGGGALRCTVRARWLAGRRHQPRAGHRRDARRPHRSRGAAGNSRRCAAHEYQPYWRRALNCWPR